MKTLSVLILLLFASISYSYAQQTEIGLLGGITKSTHKNPSSVENILYFQAKYGTSFGFFLQKNYTSKFSFRVSYRKPVMRIDEQQIQAIKVDNLWVSANASKSISPFHFEFTPLYRIGKKDKIYGQIGLGIVYSFEWLYDNSPHGMMLDYLEVRYYSSQPNRHNFLINSLVSLNIPIKKYTIGLEAIYQQSFIPMWQHDYYIRYGRRYDEYFETTKQINGSNLSFHLTIRRPWRMKPKKIS